MHHTVLFPINRHSKNRAPLISGRFYFPRQNSGQTPVKNFLKSGQVISRNYFQYKLVYLAFFFLQLGDTVNKFEVILAAREEEYKKRFVKCFLNVIYFRCIYILALF